MSRTDSPRVSCISSARRTIGCPPSSKTPDSNDVRVRVDGLLNSSATVRPSSAREESGAALSAAARWSSRSSRSASSSAPVMKCVRMRALTWNLYHGRSPEPAGRSLLNEFAAHLAGWEWDVALLQEVPPWWPPLLAAAAGRAGAPRADLAQLRALRCGGRSPRATRTS